MDDAGWILVDDILKCFNISFADLNTIIITNDKQRFKFNNDQTKICANQDHSKGVAKK